MLGFLRVGAGVFGKSQHIGGGWRQTGQVEAETPEQILRRRYCNGRDTFFLQRSKDEGIDGIVRLALHFRHLRTHERRVGPVGLIFRAFANPALDQIALGFVKRLVAFGRRHDGIRIFRVDSFHHVAFLGFARYDGKALALGQRRVGGLGEVESQPCFAMLRIRSVAADALVAEDGADVAVERQLLPGLQRHGQGKKWKQSSQRALHECKWIRHFPAKSFPVSCKVKTLSGVVMHSPQYHQRSSGSGGAIIVKKIKFLFDSNTVK